MTDLLIDIFIDTLLLGFTAFSIKIGFKKSKHSIFQGRLYIILVVIILRIIYLVYKVIEGLLRI